MRRRTQWIIGGLLTITLWASGVGAQTFPHRHHDVRHNGPERYQDHQDSRQDRWDVRHDRHQLWRDHRAGHHTTVTPDRADWRRDRNDQGRDRRDWHHNWYHGWHRDWCNGQQFRRDWSYRR